MNKFGLDRKFKSRLAHIVRPCLQAQKAEERRREKTDIEGKEEKGRTKRRG